MNFLNINEMLKIDINNENHVKLMILPKCEEMHKLTVNLILGVRPVSDPLILLEQIIKPKKGLINRDSETPVHL